MIPDSEALRLMSEILTQLQVGTYTIKVMNIIFLTQYRS